MDAIQRAVAAAYGVTIIDILSPRRGRALEARKVAMWLSRRIIGCSYPALGRAFDRDHSTVLRGVREVDRAFREIPVASR